MSDPKIPTSYDELFPGRFLKAHECVDRPTYTIKSVVIETLPTEKGEKDTGIVTFRETPKGLVLNKTNGQCLRHMFGRVLTEWVGRRVVLMCDDNVQLGRERVSGVRIYGSPDIDADTQCEIKHPKKKARMHPLKCTAKAPKPKPDPVDAAEDARVSRLQAAAASPGVTAVGQSLGATVRSVGPDTTDMRAVVTRLRAEYATLVRTESETVAAAMARATEALGPVAARNFQEWRREAEAAIAALRADREQGAEPGADG
jgi:hypothetical protein